MAVYPRPERVPDQHARFGLIQPPLGSVIGALLGAGRFRSDPDGYALNSLGVFLRGARRTAGYRD